MKQGSDFHLKIFKGDSDQTDVKWVLHHCRYSNSWFSVKLLSVQSQRTFLKRQHNLCFHLTHILVERLARLMSSFLFLTTCKTRSCASCYM